MWLHKTLLQSGCFAKITATENESRRWTPLPLSKEGRPPSTPRMEEVQLHPVFCSRRLRLFCSSIVLSTQKTIVRRFKKYGNESPEFRTHDTGKNLHICASATKLHLISGVDCLTIIKSCWHSVSNQCHEDRALPNTHQLQKGVHKTDQMLEELWSEQG